MLDCQDSVGEFTPDGRPFSLQKGVGHPMLLVDAHNLLCLHSGMSKTGCFFCYQSANY